MGQFSTEIYAPPGSLLGGNQQVDPFLQPGDTLTLRLRDDANGIDLGGQFSRVA